MKKTLQERVSAAKSSRARVADNEELLVDLRSEVDRLAGERDAAASLSIDFAVGDDERDQAAAKSARLERTIRALEIEIGEVSEATEARKSTEARTAADIEKAAALAERDAIAARFAERVPAITAELIELFSAVQANTARMHRAGVHEANAELQARNIPAHGHIQMTPALEFTRMNIPSFGGLGLAWPISIERAVLAAVA